MAPIITTTKQQTHDQHYGRFTEENELSKWRKRIALGALGTAFTGSILLISPFIVMQLRSPLPFMSTPRSKVTKALKKISSTTLNMKKQNKKLFLTDLGSGDGEAVLAAANAGWHATGVEMNPTLWAVSSIRRLLSPSHVRHNCKFILGDMWSADLRSNDAVMIFGVKPLMPKIADKISKECRPGTHVLSYRFRVPVSETNETSNGNGIVAADLVYDHEEMRVYQVR